MYVAHICGLHFIAREKCCLRLINMRHFDCLQSFDSFTFSPLCVMLTLDKIDLFIVSVGKVSEKMPYVGSETPYLMVVLFLKLELISYCGHTKIPMSLSLFQEIGFTFAMRLETMQMANPLFKVPLV